MSLKQQHWPTERFCVFFALIALLPLISIAADTIPNCKLLASMRRTDQNHPILDLAYNYIKVWEYKGLDSHNNLSDLDKDTRTYYLIHGNGAGPKEWPLEVAQKIHKTQTQKGKDIQILLIDWEEDADLMEWGFDFNNSDVVSEIISTLLVIIPSSMREFKHVEIIGHSYGAHIGGCLAQSGMLGYVEHMVALDPATEKRDLKDEIMILNNKISADVFWIDLRDNTFVETYMSSSNFGNVTHTYGNDNFVVANEGLLSYDNFTSQTSKNGLEDLNDAIIDGTLHRANHSRAWQFYKSTINDSSKVGWGWYNNGGKKEYHDLGFATEASVNMSSTIPPWRGIIYFPNENRNEYMIECIDNNLEKTGIDKWYESKIARNKYSELITSVCKAVDYRIVKPLVSVKDEQVFKVGEKATASIQFVNNIVNRAFTEHTLTYAKLVQGTSIKVWLSKTDEPKDYSEAKLLGCQVIYDDTPTNAVYSTEISLDFSGLNTEEYLDGAFLHFQIGAVSETVKGIYSQKSESDLWINSIFNPLALLQSLSLNIENEGNDAGYIEGEVNPKDNVVVIPIKLTDNFMDIAIAFDISGTMDSHILASKQNALTIARSIFENNPGAHMGLLEFNSYSTSVLTGFTSDQDTVINAINRLPNYGTGDEYIYDALKQCITGSLGSWRKDASRTIILITDEPPMDPCPRSGLTAASLIELTKKAFIDEIIEATRGENSTSGTSYPISIYTITPEYYGNTNLLEFYNAITEATGGKSYSIDKPEELVDAIIQVIDDISYGNGTKAPWYPSYSFICEHEHKAHEVWVYDGETLVTKMVVNTTEVTAADYLKAGCPGLESGKEYTFRVYEWEGAECAEAGTFTPEYGKPLSGTVTAEATEDEEIYNLHVNIPSASKFMLAVYRGDEVCYPPTEFLFTDTDEEGNIITAKTVRMEFFEAGEYTVGVLGSNLAGEADTPATCTVTIAADPVVTQYATWPETGYTPAEGQTLLQAGNDVMVTFTWPNIIDTASYNLKIYDCYGNQVKAVNGIIDCHTTVKLSDNIYFWVMEAVLTNGKVLTSPGCNFVVAMKNDAPIISRIEAVEDEPTKVRLVCDKASSNYQNVSYDIQFYTAAGGWRDYMDGNAISVTFSDEDEDGVFTGVIDFRTPVSGAYLLIRPRIKGKLITDKQTLFRLP